MVVCLKRRYYRLSQGEVENVSEDTCPLLSACSEYASSLSVWPYSLVKVDLFKGLTHIGYEERDHTVVWNSWCSHACFSVAGLEVRKKCIQLIC